MVKKVKCPTCGRTAAWDPANAWRPFCSERCRQIDLGAWASDKFAIAGSPLETEFADDPAGRRFPPPPSVN